MSTSEQKDKQLIFWSAPPVAGYWQIGGPDGLHVSMPRRPIWLHRAMCRLVLGFHWIDKT